MKYLFISFLSLFMITVCMAERPSTTESQQETVHRFIRDSWEKTVRFHTEDEGIRIGLPYKYTVPSISGAFQEMYYWDTYFTGEGLILDGQVDLANRHADHMLYMVEKFGKIAVLDTLKILLTAYLTVESEAQLCSGVIVENIPHLGLTVCVMSLRRQLVVRMNLYRKDIRGVNEFYKQREFKPEFLIHRVANKVTHVNLYQLLDVVTRKFAV